MPFTTTPSGLRFEDTIVGSGAAAQVGRNVTVHYTGWLFADGNKRRKQKGSNKRGQRTLSFETVMVSGVARVSQANNAEKWCQGQFFSFKKMSLIPFPDSFFPSDPSLCRHHVDPKRAGRQPKEMVSRTVSLF